MSSSTQFSDRISSAEFNKIYENFEDLENHWLDQAKSQSSEKQHEITQQINALAHEIRSQLIVMSSTNLSQREFTIKTTQHFEKFSCLCQKFFKDSATYETSRSANIQRQDAFIETIKSDSSDFAPFQRRTRTRERDLLENDPFWINRKDSIDQRIGTAAVVSAVFNAIAVPVEIAFEGVKIAADSFCNANETTQAVCKKVEDLVDTGLEATGLRTGLNKMAHVHEENRSLMSIMLEKDFMIPTQTGEKYVDDASNIAMNMAGLGATFGVMAGARKVLGKSHPVAPVNTFESVQVAPTATLQSTQVAGEVNRELSSMPSIGIHEKYCATELKKQAAQKAYINGLQQERMFPTHHIDRLVFPENFPKNLNEFYLESKVFQFNKNHIGVEGKGSVRANILYQKISDNEALFLIANDFNSSISTDASIISNKFTRFSAFARPITANYVHASEKLSFVLDSTINFSRELGLQRIYLTWKSNRHAVLTELKKLGKEASSIGSFPIDVNEKTLRIIEINLSQTK